jgi:hypothetical protein
MRLEIELTNLVLGIAAAITVATGTLVVTSCTTATYGNKFAADPQVPNQYR